MDFEFKNIVEIRADLKRSPRGLPWLLRRKESTYSAGDAGLIPDPGIPCAAEQLCPRATTFEPVLKSPGATTTEVHVP